MPIVESMACGVPVVASNCTSIPEVCGEAAAALVSPEDYKSAAEALMNLERDSEYYRLKSEQGIKRASEFSWDRSAQILSKK